MDRSGRFLPAVLFLCFILLASEMGTMVMVEGRNCNSQSHRFEGTCLRSSNCASVCQTEGFPGGECVGLRRRCFCTRQC